MVEDPFRRARGSVELAAQVHELAPANPTLPYERGFDESFAMIYPSEPYLPFQFPCEVESDLTKSADDPAGTAFWTLIV